MSIGNTRGGLPYEPRTLAELQPMLAAALAPLFSVALINKGMEQRPSQRREHVLDLLEPPTRIMVSREQFADGRVYVHISASASWYGEDPGEALKRLGLLVFCDLLAMKGSEAVPFDIHVSPGRVIHFMVTDPAAIERVMQAAEQLAGQPEQGKESNANPV